MTALVRWWLALLLAAFALGFAVVEHPQPADARPVPVSTATFPLRVSDDGRYLVDSEARPFMVVGDSAWSLVADLKEEDVKLYLDDRQRRGFNSIIVNLVEHKFSSDPPRNRAGVEPFKTKGDFSHPNPAYFDFAHKVIAMANERGIAVWLAPAYLGWTGTDQGFFQEIKAGGAEKLKVYGRFVGERFKDLPNIVWMVGGDYAVPSEFHWMVTDLATGIRAAGATQLMTVHGGGQSAVDVVGEQPWIDINNTYRFEAELLRDLRADYARSRIRPFVLVEAIYENEHKSRPEQIRRQAYWAMTTGACGQFFGNHPIWHFDGPGHGKAPRSWREELDGTGSRDMTRLRSAFVDRAWYRLVPDRKGELVTKGTGAGIETITAAATSDGKLAMVYIPSTGREPRELTVDLSRFSGPVSASWFNPTNGGSVPAFEGPAANAGSRVLRTPGDNGTKTNDWLLILEVAA